MQADTPKHAYVDAHLAARGAAQAAPAPVAQVPQPDTWRTLALQFDGHRMQALWHLKMLLECGEDHAEAVRTFLAGPPLHGEIVLAQRIAAYAQPAPVAEDAIALLSEVTQHFTRDDDLPNDLLPRIDALLRAQAAPAYKDSTPELSVGESSFEGWFGGYDPAGKGDKQRARDAYAAGMGDPLVTVAPAPVAEDAAYAELHGQINYIAAHSVDALDALDRDRLLGFARSLVWRAQTSLEIANLARAQAAQPEGGAKP